MTSTNPFLDRNRRPSGPTGDGGQTGPTQQPGQPMESPYHGRHAAAGSMGYPYQNPDAGGSQFPMDQGAGRFERPSGPTAAPYGLAAEPPQVQEEAMTAAADGGHPLGLPYYGCPMGDAVIRFFRNYAKFSGRASRSEYWWVVLATVIATTIFGMLATGFPGIIGGVFAVLFIVFELSIIVPSLALMTRRAHDSNLSGWWVFGYCAANALASSLAVSAFVQALTPLKMVVIENSNSVATLSQTSINSGATMMMGVSSLLSLATFVLFLVITLRKPRPEGVRFDKQTIPTPPMGPGDGNVSDGRSDTDSFSNIID